MKQKIHYLFMLLLMLVTGVGGVKAEEIVYTLSYVEGKNNTYDGNCDIDINGITWNVSGNSTMNPWRIGGKSIKNTDRAVYSKTAMAFAISKVELTVGAASSITVNSLKLIVASDADYNNQIDEVSATFSANSTITFTPTSGTEWVSNAYYKFVFNVTVSGDKNKFVEFKEAKFYKPESSGPGDPIVSFTNERFEVAKGKSAVNEISKPSDLDVTYESSDQGVASVNATTGEVTGVAIGEATVTAKWNAVVDKYNSGSKSYTVVVREPTPQELALLYESWSKSSASTDGSNELGITSSNLDYNNWKEFSKVYQGAGQCGKLGTQDATGKMTTKEIALRGNGNLTFKIKKYGSDSGKLKVSATGATIVGVFQFSPTSTDEWTDCTINLVNGNGEVTIVLETTSKRMYIDDIMLLEVPTYKIDVVSNNASYGSVVMENNVITATPAEGYRFATPAYTITSGEAEIEQDGNTFIITAKSDCQVQINLNSAAL